MTADLADWLTQVWDEQEEAAREAYYEGQRWLPEEESVITAPDWDVVYTADRKVDARHIARHDPASVLARIAADRQILARCSAHLPPTSDRHLLTDVAMALAVLAEATIRDLAQPYADRPGFEEAWRVTP